MSPHARGLHPEPDRVVHVHGIIPARAGFTIIMASSGLLFGDHPRSRGVYTAGQGKLTTENGSSPLARGLRRHAEDGGENRGIIPARAGFTGTRWLSPSRGTDHPRSRGVYNPHWEHGIVAEGSSPLARGLHQVAGGGVEVGGIIPARAGFTAPAIPRPLILWDHPRSRGVYTMFHVKHTSPSGSSPLARGLRIMRSLMRPPTRIIPARAGFTQ